MSRTLNYSVGCHAGFNLPDRWAASAAAGLDFAQAYLAKGATYIANTGFGYGMDDSADLSELLMLHFQEQLGAPDPQTGLPQDVPVGWALGAGQAALLQLGGAGQLRHLPGEDID